jgi:2-C-methyl-D-erythritol 4-phosphate cytidylyltransferase
MNNFAAIVCAAGASVRMGDGIKKEYRPLDESGLTMLGAAVSAFAAISEIKTIVITVPDDPLTGEAAARNALPLHFLTGGCGPAIRFVSGGATRQASVYNALTALAERPPDFVLIHDGARPWVSLSLIMRIIAEVRIHRAVVPLLPLTETPKETDAPLDDFNTVFIKQHLRRALIGAAQTPQGFAFPEILAAHQKAAADDSAEFTDDAEIWGAFYGPVAAIPGEFENRKITFPEDLL